MLRTLLISLTAGAVLAQGGGAAAADLKMLTKAPIYKAPPPPPTWTGFFVGGNIGLGRGHETYLDNFPVPDGAIDATPAPKGWLGGFQAGYNHQIGWLVLGVGGDFTWTGVNSQFTCFSFGNQVCSADVGWMGTLTGKVGAAFGPTMLYVKGGAAWAHNTFTNLATCSGPQPRSSGGIPATCGDSFDGHDTRPGWTIGGGVEYRFMAQWSVFAEYDLLRFEDKSVLFDDGLGNFFTEEIQEDVQIVKAGVNYQFNPFAASSASAYGYKRPGLLVRKAPAKEGADEDEPPQHVLAFAGLDVGRESLDGWAGGLIAPWQDLDTSGPRVWILGGAGMYKYPASGSVFRGVSSEGEILAGYGFEGDTYSVNLLAGLNAENQMVSPVDPDNPVQGTAGGVKVRADAYANPTPQILTYVEGEYSTAFQTYYTSGKVGYDITAGKQIFLGPQVSFFGDERYHQWRFGAHLSNIKIQKVEIDLYAGYAKDSVVGDGAYGRIEVSRSF